MNEKLKQSLTKILSELEADRLGAVNSDGGCVYENEDGKHCAIGCLFDAEKIKEIKMCNANSFTAEDLFFKFEDMTELTGMTVRQAMTLQNWHDNVYAQFSSITKDVFRRMLTGLIAGWIKEIPSNPDPLLHNDVSMISFAEEEVQA